MKPVLLAILDGVGLRDEIHGNAFMQAKKHNIDYLMREYPNIAIDASGTRVGLPDGQMGNSEVGHLNIGGGRIVYQPLELISNAIKTGEFFNNEVLIAATDNVKQKNGKLHIFGLVSDGGVHSHIDHIIALLKHAKQQDIARVYLHCFTDGRDTAPNIALTFLKQIEKAIDELGVGKIATISGRYYAMDRDERWERTKLAYDAIANGIGPYNSNIEAIINENYGKEIYDEFIIPTVVDKSGTIEDNDTIIIANFRPDRLIQISNALTQDDFDKFEVKQLPNLKLYSMMPITRVEEEISIFLKTMLKIQLENTYLS